MQRVLAVALALSQPAWAVDLMDIYREARSQDATFASAQAAYQAGLEKLPQGRAGLLPSLGLSGNWTRVYSEPDGFASSRYNTGGYTLSLAQPVYRPANWAFYEQSKQQVAQAEATFSAAEQDLITRVAQAYFDVLLAQDNVTVSEASKTAIAEQLAQAKRNFEVGTATITDTNEAQARFDQATAKLISDQNDLEIKKQALRVLISRIPDYLTPLNEQVVLPLPKPNNIEEWVTASEANNQSLAIQRASLEIAKKEIERQRAGHLPTLDLVASRSDTHNGSIGDVGARIDIGTSQVGVQVSIPIYSGGATQSRVREAIANRDRATQDLEAGRRSVTQNARTAFLGVTSGVAQVGALEQALKSAQVSLESTKLGREVGVRTSLDVLNAQQLQFQARRDLLQARYSVIINQLRLKAASGQLVEADLEEVNRLLAK